MKLVAATLILAASTFAEEDLPSTTQLPQSLEDMEDMEDMVDEASTSADDDRPSDEELRQSLEDMAGEITPERECAAGQGEWTTLTELKESLSWRGSYKGVKCKSTVSFSDADGNCPDTMDAVKAAALASDACAQPPTIYAIPDKGCKCVPAPEPMPDWVPADRQYAKNICEPIPTKYEVDVLYYGCTDGSDPDREAIDRMESNYAVATIPSSYDKYLTDEQSDIIGEVNLENVPGAVVDDDGYVWTQTKESCVSQLADDDTACYRKASYLANFWRADQPIGGNSNAALVVVASVALVCLAIACAALSWVHFRAKKYARMEEEVTNQPSNYVI